MPPMLRSRDRAKSTIMSHTYDLAIVSRVPNVFVPPGEPSWRRLTQEQTLQLIMNVDHRTWHAHFQNEGEPRPHQRWGTGARRLGGAKRGHLNGGWSIPYYNDDEAAVYAGLWVEKRAKALGLEVRVEPSVNKKVWSKGIRNVPRRIRIRLSRKRNEDEEAEERLYTLVQVSPDTTIRQETKTIDE